MSVTLLHLSRSEPLFKEIARKFHEKWDTNDEARPHIKHIFYVKHLSPHAQTHLHQYSNYSSSVGNVQELFHGTQRTCRTGDHTEWVKPCHHSDCFMCSILKCSFNLSLAGSRTGKMFGSGVYTTDTASKAAKYATSTDPRSSNRVVMLSSVAVGNTYLATQANSGLTSAPPGYNSVTGATTSQGGLLRHPETIVYRQDAICVAAVVVFYHD